MQAYNEQFYQFHLDGARRSAREIVPLVLEVIRPEDVIDVGCGVGAWLAVFKEYGVKNIWGVDGDYVNPQMLDIPADRFISFDLTKPLELNRQFDLVVSLEVAEHLPAECAATFIDSLTRLGPVILFSAAIPFQGGVHHVNEQWPEYWAKRFEAVGFVVIDWVRKRIWQNENVEWFYAQNLLMFARRDYVESHPALRREFECNAGNALSLVHPKKYLEIVEWNNRVRLTSQELVTLIPAGDAFILVDEAQLNGLATAGRRIIPFPERDGYYAGPPPDDEAALGELERLRQTGAQFIAFAWPAFWWLNYYSGLHRHLRSEFRCVLENDRLVVFDLRP